MYSYESVMLLAAALQKSRSTKGEAIKRALVSAGTLKGLQDDFSLDAYGDADRGYMVFGVRDGRFVRVR
jgi:ABC-type branched-subunit amino acid transport system substrate-binding protein